MKFLGNSLVVGAIIVATSLSTTGVFAQGKSAAAKAAKPAGGTIVDQVIANPDFSILKAAVLYASTGSINVAAALSGSRQLTVFAPNDAAFIAALPGDTKEEVVAWVVANLSPDEVAAILLYHVIPGRHTSTSVTAAPGYTTLLGERLTRDELVAAGLGALDISASNGVIHQINSVLLP